ncbi:MAG: helix-turn-helix domain-containing protein [Lachnospiraceae bacterium]|nr:helix-turn-helix domain-containing protein [Lachnospiraceae bacterium]
MKNFELKTAWGIRRRKGDHIQFHDHNFYELVYYSNGSGRGRVGTESYTFSANTFVLIPPYMEHEECLQADSDVLCVGFLTGEAFDFQLLNDSQGIVYGIVKTILREATEQPLYYKEMILVKSDELMLEMRRLENTRPQNSTKNFEYVINYIAQNYHEKITLRSMAEQMHISYDYFQHRFKEIQGESPQQFLVHTRVEAAERMLSDKTLSCTEIAYRCGFSNSAQFSAMFKRAKGITPQQYRQTGKKDAGQ